MQFFTKLFIGLMALTLPMCGIAEIKTVVFDYGGVVASVDRSVVVAGLSELFGVESQAIEKALVEARSVRQSGGSEVAYWEDFAERQGLDLSDGWTKELQAINQSGLQPIEGVFELIDQLKEKGIAVALFSNITSRYALVVRKLGHYDRFDHVILSCDTRLKKPDSASYQNLFERLDCSPAECFFIDDNPRNIQVGKELGMDGVVFESVEQIKGALLERDIALN